MKLLVTVFLGIISSIVQCQVYNMANSVVTTCSGTFYDSGGGAGNYTSNQNLTMTFNPAVLGNAVQVTFTAMDIQADYDLLYVYDGNSTAAPLIAIFCGTVLPGTVTASNTNVTGSLTFNFTSNGFTNRPGWAATLSCVAPGTPVYAMQNGTFTTCNAKFYDSGGLNQVYHWNENSVITFCPALAGTCTSISFNPISLELDYDFLYIYDGNSTAAPLIAKFGDNAPAQVFTASASNPSGCLTVRFTTDGWDNRAGWDATVSCVPCIPVPYYAIDAINNNSITDCSFYVTDNGGANSNYLNNSNEYIKICSNSVPNPYVNISFLQFDTEAGFDILKVYDGPSALFPLIGTFSGTTIPPLISSSDPSGCLYLTLTTDAGVTRPGFVALVACSPIVGLPIELLSFTGTCVDGKIKLKWATASETNNDFFTIERTLDGTVWSVIGTVDGAGTSSSILNYCYSDNSPFNETSYYRLKQTDYNGQFSYSNIIAMNNCIIHNNEFNIWPNPSSGQFTFETGLTASDSLCVSLYNSIGQIINKNSYPADQKQIELNYAWLQEGIYFIEVSDNFNSLYQVGKIVIEK